MLVAWGCIEDPDDPYAPPPPPSPRGSCSTETLAPSPGERPCLLLGNEGERVAARLAQLWGTAPRYICAYLPNSGVSNSCAVLPPNNAMYCPRDDSIAWDANYMNQMYFAWGRFAPAVFLAHEWGHLNQARTLMLPPSSTKATELQADCFAGVFTAAEEHLGQTMPSDISTAFMSFCQWGDPFQSGWFDPGAHGTCQERMAAFMAGYGTAQSCADTLCDDPLATAVTICTRGSCR